MLKHVANCGRYCVPANRPNLIGIVLIFESQNLKNYSDFQKEKKNIFFLKIWNWLVKDCS